MYMVAKYFFNVILKILFEAPFHISYDRDDIWLQRIRYFILWKKDVSYFKLLHDKCNAHQNRNRDRFLYEEREYQISNSRVYTTYKRGRLYANIAHPQANWSARRSISKVAILTRFVGSCDEAAGNDEKSRENRSACRGANTSVKIEERKSWDREREHWRDAANVCLRAKAFATERAFLSCIARCSERKCPVRR